jgi:hypothetical protein
MRKSEKAMIRFGREADGAPIVEIKMDGEHHKIRGEKAVTIIRGMLEKGQMPKKQRPRAETILADEDTLRELGKRWDAASKEIQSHEGKATLWHTVSEDARAVHWALYLDDTLRERAQQEGVDYELDPQFYWVGIALHGVRNFFKIPVDLDDLPPSFTDPFDDGPARFRSNEDILATGHSDAKPMLDEFDRLKRNRLADAVSKSVAT